MEKWFDPASQQFVDKELTPMAKNQIGREIQFSFRYQFEKRMAWIWMKQDRVYQKKRQMIEKYIKKHKILDYSRILNEVDIGYDTLMKIISELRNEGRLK